MQKIISNSVEQTQQVAKNLASTLKGGDVLLLKGDLGAGKTTFTKGLLSFFGIDQNAVVSPTFTLMQQYDLSRLTFDVRRLVHIDTYRLEHEDDLIEIGVEDYLDDDETVTIIEWPEKIKKLLEGKDVVRVDIEHISEMEREITITKNS